MTHVGPSPIRFWRTASSCTQIVCSAGRSGFPCPVGQEEEAPHAHGGFCTEAQLPCPPWISPDLRNNFQALPALPGVFSLQRQSPASRSLCRPGTEPQTHSPHPESLAGSSPLSELESNAKFQADLWWIVGGFFLLFDSKYPGMCFLTLLCIHAENKQSLYKTPNISP